MSEVAEAKSLRWLENMFPWTPHPKDENDKLSNAIHLYAKRGADKIDELSKLLLEERKVTYNGIPFDSKRERDRYIFLRERQNRGEISDLELQTRFELVPKQSWNGKAVRNIVYIADFVYTENGKTVVEDAKGYRGGQAYNTFKIKKKLMLERYGIWIEEV